MAGLRLPAVQLTAPYAHGVSSEVRLLTARDVRELAEQLGVRPTKRLGQNFVIDPNTVRRIARASHPLPDDVVVEVGPGLG